MEELSKKKCVPCQGGIPPLTRAQATPYLKKTPGWELVKSAKKIQRKFGFKNFLEAMQFINNVAAIAEQEGHHPDIFVSYNKVTVSIYTHKINGLHENDFILAAKISKLLE